MGWLDDLQRSNESILEKLTDPQNLVIVAGLIIGFILYIIIW